MTTVGQQALIGDSTGHLLEGCLAQLRFDAGLSTRPTHKPPKVVCP